MKSKHRKNSAKPGEAKRPERVFDLMPFWFKAVLLISIAIRLYLVFSTEGTYDLEIWQHHTDQIREIGLIRYYEASRDEVITRFNHPPFAAFFVSGLSALSRVLGIPFKIIFRLLFALSDFLAAFYLLRIFAADKRRYVYAAFYLLNPVTFILSAYHGNTDSALALLLVASVYYISQKQYWAAGALFGLGGNIKWIIALAMPALFFSIPGLRQKARFIISALAVCIMGYLWAMVSAPATVIGSVFGYGGLTIKTASGFIWGLRMPYEKFAALYTRFLPFPAAGHFNAALSWYSAHTQGLLLCSIVLYSWMRRHRRSAAEIGATVAVVFCIFYAITSHWAFQYLAWAAPFLIFLGLPTALALAFFSSGYLYLFYSFVCQSPFLQGRWDLAGRPYLPGTVWLFRDLSILSFAAIGLFFFCKILYQNIKDLRYWRA